MDSNKDMTMARTVRWLGVWMGLLMAVAAAQERPEVGGEVTVPLARYTQLLAQVEQPARAAPADYALGQAEVQLLLKGDRQQGMSAEVTTTLLVEILTDEWVAVPLLPLGTTVTDSRVDGSPVALIQTPQGLIWSTQRAGQYRLQLTYSAPLRPSGKGVAVTFPLPESVGARFTAKLPPGALELSLAPAVDLERQESDDSLTVSAKLPPVAAATLFWKLPLARSHAISRARYRGELQDEALRWSAAFEVEVFSPEGIELPLLPIHATISDLRINDEPGLLLVDQGRFVTLIDAPGRHRVDIDFQVPVASAEGAPSATVPMLAVPVSHFRLTLPGHKEVEVTPSASVSVQQQSERASTVVAFYAPLGESLTFRWRNAPPPELQTQVRANASIYHAFHASEGVLHGRAIAVVAITRGEATQLAFELPAGVEINRVEALSTPISDWTAAPVEGSQRQRLALFLLRPTQGEVTFEVSFEQLLGANRSDPITLPLMTAQEVHRQRGMAALLANADQVLKPLQAVSATEVGENQLPAQVRNRLQQAVAHTYKYIDPEPQLVVQSVAPERQQGAFDAQVDTLISVGEVTIRGATSVDLNVKSGSIMDLALQLPQGINLLGVTGPSLRTYEVTAEGNQQRIDLDFTQEMTGQLRLELNYEHILSDGETAVAIPKVTVAGAQVEHGRLAVEALTAVEIQAEAAEQLSPLEVNELPRQLVLKTTNPILMAFKYVHAEPPFRLVLTMTRHREIGVKVADIESARYQTLMTEDGLAVTAVQLQVRNSRRQFLRLQLPQASEVWSVFVNGNPEKPARASDGSDAVLVKMINSATPFSVAMVYATPLAAMSGRGTLQAELPQPDMVVTQTHWDLYLPASYHYLPPESNLQLVARGEFRASDAAARLDTRMAAVQANLGQPLRIDVPAQGLRFAFEKLYASQSPRQPFVAIPYLAAPQAHLLYGVSGAGVAAAVGGLLLLGARRRWHRALAAALLLSGLALALLPLFQARLDPRPILVLAAALLLLAVVNLLVRRTMAWWRERQLDR